MITGILMVLGGVAVHGDHRRDLGVSSGRRWTAAVRRWQSDRVLFVLDSVPDDPRPWDQIPGVALVGVVIGLVIVFAAIRYMINKK